MGIARGANLFLLACGFSLIFGTLRVINLAHATFYIIGAYICYSCVGFLGSSNGFWLGLLVAPIAVALLAAIFERGLLRYVYKRGDLYQLLLTWAMVFILGDLIKFVWGGATKAIPPPAVLSGAVRLPFGNMATAQLFSIGIAVLVFIGFHFLLYRTRVGLLTRATAANPEITEALGTDITNLHTFIFALSCWLGGLGGAIGGLLAPVYVGKDVEYLLLAFIIAVVGGTGSITGCLVASLIIGVVYSLGILVLPAFAMVFLYAIMVLVLLVRPYGLFGKPI